MSSDPWAKLRAATPARIGLGRSGAGLPTARELEFRLAHARARDAVHAPMDAEGLAQALSHRPTVIVNSAAPDRSVHLRRPDLGPEFEQFLRDTVSGVSAAE